MKDEQNKEQTSQKINGYKKELQELCGKGYLIGHRGANNYDDPFELANIKAIEDRISTDVNRANGLAFYIKANTLGVEPSDYGAVAVVSTRDELSKRLLNGYHPNDIFVPLYGLGLEGLHELSEKFMLWRKSGTPISSNAEEIWDQSMLWRQIALEFGGTDDAYKLNPVHRLLELRQSQLSLGRNVSYIDAAIAEIYTKLSLEVPSEHTSELVLNSSMPNIDPLDNNQDGKSSDNSSIKGSHKEINVYSEIYDIDKGWEWMEIAEEFGYMANEIADPIGFLEKMKQGQEALGRNIEMFDRAIQEIKDRIS